MRGMKLLLQVVLASMLLLAFTSGCGFKDIDKRFFVVAMGIDQSTKDNYPYLITLKLAIPSPRIEPGAAKVQIEQIHASSIAEGVRLLKSHVDKELDFGHCKVFILGEQIARQSLEESVSWLTKRRDIQFVADLAVGQPTAETVLITHPITERYPGNTLFLSFGRDGTESSYIMTEFLFDMTKRLTEKGLDPILPIITSHNNSFNINRVALFNKKQMLAELPPRQTRILNQLTREFSKSSAAGSIGTKDLTLNVSRISKSYRIHEPADAPPYLTLRVKATGLLEEAPRGIYNEDWNMLERKIGEGFSQEIQQLLLKLQKLGVDPIGFGLRYRATHLDTEAAWERWQRIYPSLEFRVETEVTIEGTGLTR